jgi:hypothetical protein
VQPFSKRFLYIRNKIEHDLVCSYTNETTAIVHLSLTVCSQYPKDISISHGLLDVGRVHLGLQLDICPEVSSRAWGGFQQTRLTHRSLARKLYVHQKKKKIKNANFRCKSQENDFKK